MKSLIYTIILFTALLFIFSGCEGPAGPQGEQGPAGDDGSANVQTFEFPYNENDVIFDSQNSNLAYVDFSVPELTQSIVDSGLVQAYYNGTLNSNTGWLALPFTRGLDDNGDGTPDNIIEFTYAYGEGLVEIIFFNTTDNNIIISDILEGRIKVVLIPPSSAGKQKPINLSTSPGHNRFVELYGKH